MNAAARNFLLQAHEVIVEQFDQDRSTVLPVNAWPQILEQLRLHEDDNAAMFLKDHCEAYGQGAFTYRPLLEALRDSEPQQAAAPDLFGRAPQDDDDHAQQGQCRGLGYSQSQSCQGQDPDQSQGYDQGGHPSHSPGNDSRGPLDQRGQNHEQTYEHGCSQDQDYGDRPGGQYPQGMPSQQGSPQRSPDSEYGESVLDEDEETFWARRAGAIQRLYHMWDCNTLSNEGFGSQLQQILGDRADVASPESEFVRLTNKHRNARNLKFAHLMTALRRDAGCSVASKCGSSYAGSAYGGGSVAGYPAGGVRGSYQASEAPSDMGSEFDAMSAAGLPTAPRYAGHGSNAGGKGRKHYQQYAGDQRSYRGADGLRRLPEAPPEAQQRPYYTDRGRLAAAQPIDENASTYRPSPQFCEQQMPAPCRAPPEGPPQDSDQGWVHPPQDPRGAMQGDHLGYHPSDGRYEDQEQRRYEEQRYEEQRQSMMRQARGEQGSAGQAGDGADRPSAEQDPGNEQEIRMREHEFWMRQKAEQDQARSQLPPSECGYSVADSQATGYSQRNLRGHGNILTWGSSARDVTPERRRGGRALVTDYEDNSQLRAHRSNNIFGQ